MRVSLYRFLTMNGFHASPGLFPAYVSDILKGFSFITFDYVPDPQSCDSIRQARYSPRESNALGPGNIQTVEKMMELALTQAHAEDYEESGGDYEEAEHTWREILHVHTPRSFFHYQAAKYHLCQALRKQRRLVAVKDIAWDLQKDLRARCAESHPLVINSSMLYIYAIAAQRRTCEASGRFTVNKEALEKMRTGPYASYYESCQDKMKHLESEILYRTAGTTAIPVFLRFELDVQIAKSWNKEKIRAMSAPHQSKEDQEMQISNFAEVARTDLQRRCQSGLSSRDPSLFIARQTLGLLLSKAGQHLSAEQHWREMFELQEKTYPGSARVNISNLSHALNEQGKHEEAEKVALDAIAHLEACLSKDSRAVLAAWRQIVIAHAKQGFKQEAMLLYHLLTIRIENMKCNKWNVSKQAEQVAGGELARRLSFGRNELMKLELHVLDTEPRALKMAQGLPSASARSAALLCTDEAKTLVYELEKSFLETV